MFDAIPNVVYIVANVFKTIYVLSLWVGWAITMAIVGTIKGIIAVTNNVLLAVEILCEDFLCFLEDLGDLTEKLILGSVDTLWSTFESFFAFSGLIVFGISSIPNSVYQMVMSVKIGFHLVNFVVLVKDAVLLLGICIWEAFALLFVGLSYLNQAPYILFLLAARAADKMIYDFLVTVETYWFRSVCGLCLGYGTYLVSKNTGVLPEEGLAHLLRLILKCLLNLISWTPRYQLPTRDPLLHSLLGSGVGSLGSNWRVCSYFKTVGHCLLALSLTCCQFLQSAMHHILGFFKSKTDTLKTCCTGVVREAISHTNTKAGLQIKLEKEKAATQCVVCMDKRRDVMILNCRHLLMCRQCAVTVAVSTGACPVCRSPIDNIISVFT